MSYNGDGVVMGYNKANAGFISYWNRGNKSKYSDFSIELHEKAINCLCFTNKGKKIVTGGIIILIKKWIHITFFR